MKSEVSQLRDALERTQYQAYNTISQQQSSFEQACQNFQNEARDVAQVEVAQAEAREKGNMMSAVNDASHRLRAENQTVTNLHQALNQIRIQAESALQGQKADIVNQAENALQQQKDAVIFEAQQALEDERHKIRNMENEFSSIFTQAKNSAEGDLMQKDAEIYRILEQLKLSEQQATDSQHRLLSEKAKFQREYANVQSTALQKIHFLEDQSAQTQARLAGGDPMQVDANEKELANCRTEIQQMQQNEALPNMFMKQELDLQESMNQSLTAQNESMRMKIDQQRADFEAKDKEAQSAKEAMAEKLNTLEDQMAQMQILMQQQEDQKTDEYDIATDSEEQEGAEEQTEASKAHLQCGTPFCHNSPTVIHCPECDIRVCEECQASDDPKLCQNCYVPKRDYKGSNDGKGAGGDSAQPKASTSEPSAKNPPPEPTKASTADKTKEAEKVKLQNFPSVKNIKGWKMHFKKEVASASGRPKEAFVWIAQVEKALTIEELEDDEDFETLGAKIATAMSEIIHGEFARKIEVLKQKAAKLEIPKMINGRQMAFLVYQHFRTSEVETQLLDINDLLAVELKGDNLMAFLNEWELTLEGLKIRYGDDILESLLRRQLENSISFATTLALYDQDTVHKGQIPSYDKLLNLLKVFLEERRRRRTRDALKGAPAAKGAAAKGKGKGKNPKAKQGDCRSFLKNGKCSRGGDCPFAHDETKANSQRGRPTERGRGKGGKSSDRSRGKGSDAQSNRGNITIGKTRAESKGKSPSGKLNRKPCFNFLKGECNKGKACDFWHIPVCSFYSQGSCRSGKQCIFVHDAKQLAAQHEEQETAEQKKKRKKAEALAKKKAKKAALALNPNE